MTTLVVVDGANLVEDVGRYLTESAPSSASQEVQRAYFTSWFDIDRLVAATIGDDLRLDPFGDLGTVILHSVRGIGTPGTVYCLEDTKTTEPFWARQGGVPGTSTQLVHFKGKEDKGVVTALVVYLFETIDSWDDAVIFSRDAEFVPAVWALRRKGKRVFCSAPETEYGSPLAQACQTFMPWDVDYLRADRALFEFLQPAGGLEQWLVSDVVHGHQVAVTVEKDALILSPSFGVEGGAVLTEAIRQGELCAEEIGEGLHLRIRRRPQTQGPELVEFGSHVLDGFRRYHFLFRSARWYKHLRVS